MDETTRGSCLCGAVRFSVEGSFDAFYLCHCARCRKDSGSAHAANLFSGTARLHWLEGETDVRHFTLPGTSHARAFCATCGSALPRQLGPQMLMVPAGSLDDAPVLGPMAHICCDDRAGWDNDLHRLPQLPGLPG